LTFAFPKLSGYLSIYGPITSVAAGYEGKIFITKQFFMATNLQDYELMVIFTPVLAEDEYKAAQKKYADFIKENGGKIVHENAWGLRSLAYPIDKKTTGLYWVLEYQADPQS